MVANNKTAKKMYGSSTSCARTIGGRCVGNCRKADSNLNCMRTVGGRCVGNCRKSDAR